jgi:hypothetical protein
MGRQTSSTFAAAVFLAGISTFAETTVVETFDGGSNQGGWSFGTGNEVIESTGGNPGAYLHDSFVDTFAPQPRTSLGKDSPFTGDFRARRVSSVGIDLITYDVDFSADGRPLTVMLISDNRTPSDFSDDWAAYSIGAANVPRPGQGWLSYDFAIPSQETSLPAGWNTIAFGPNSPANPDWNAAITQVAQLRYFYGDPELFFIFQAWDLGMDNPRITRTSPAPVPTVDGVGMFSATFLLLIAGVISFRRPMAVEGLHSGNGCSGAAS